LLILESIYFEQCSRDRANELTLVGANIVVALGASVLDIPCTIRAVQTRSTGPKTATVYTQLIRFNLHLNRVLLTQRYREAKLSDVSSLMPFPPCLSTPPGGKWGKSLYTTRDRRLPTCCNYIATIPQTELSFNSTRLFI